MQGAEHDLGLGVAPVLMLRGRVERDLLPVGLEGVVRAGRLGLTEPPDDIERDS